MYSNLLALDNGITRTDMVLANSNSTLEASPYQRADLMQALQAFEDAMCETSEYRHQLPLLLRDLAGDGLVYDALTAMLEAYPVLAGSSYQAAAATAEAPSVSYVNDQASSVFDNFATASLLVSDPFGSAALALLDISEQFAANLNQRLAKVEQIYGAVYNLVSGVDDTLSSANQVLSYVGTQGIDTLRSMMAALLALKALFFKPSLKGIKDALASLLMPRLVAEVSLFAGVLDRMASQVTAPLQNLLRETDAVVSRLAGIEANVAYMVSPTGLTGVVKNHIQDNNIAGPSSRPRCSSSQGPDQRFANKSLSHHFEFRGSPYYLRTNRFPTI
ncbi:MAG: hypothetical protein M3Y27_23965, partial [Acidobacteriota bacterium]|nr:hypothetical protein [Acidobacteriota bacterium]